jgi:glutathione peroxidase
MKQFFFSLPVLLLFGFLSYGFLNMNNISIQQTKGDDEVNKSIYNFSVKDIDGKEIKLSDYKGKVLLIVNVASRCGFTKQYNGLEEIYRKYKERGFEILAFPCNDFGNQEPGTNEEIKEFCSSKFDVSFQLFDKVKVLGDDKEPLYAFLTDNPVTGKSDIGWNFEKFIVDREGNIVKRLKSNVDPLSEILITVLEEELQK